MKPTYDQIKDRTVSQVMKEYFSDVKVFDYALPQMWVYACQARGIDPRGTCVWNYDNKNCGEPLFFTDEWQRDYDAAMVKKATA